MAQGCGRRRRPSAPRAKEIQERLGHSTIRVTFDRYGHLLPGLDERLREGLEEMYRAGHKARPSES